jgi:hypothetical protein
VIGNNVLSADGNMLGEVTDVILVTGERPEAVGYEVKPPDGHESVFVPIAEQVALSADNLVVPADATAFIRNDLAGFGAAVEAYRTATDDEEGSS